jgi:peptide deformylase
MDPVWRGEPREFYQAALNCRCGHEPLISERLVKMAVKPVLRMGDARLIQIASAIAQFDTPQLHELLADMHDTMSALSGAGLAAPQIGVSQRVVIFGVGQNPRYPDAAEVPYTVLINPVLQPLDEEVEEGWEGCLSVPGMRGLVPRYKHLRYTGFDAFGTPIDRTVSGFHARVVQHEVDHLDGVLYPTRIRDLRNFGFNEELFPGVVLADD